MITMVELCRRNPKRTFAVILLASAWTSYYIYDSLYDSPYLVLKHSINSELNTSIVSPLPVLNHTINSELNSAIVPSENDRKLQNRPPGPKSKITNRQSTSQASFPTISATRIKIKKEIQDFLHFIHKKESQLIPELGGTPIRCMLSTTWRSGSTFTGQSLALHPGAFYHYEPLWKAVGIHRIRSLSKAQKTLRELENQLLCNYTAVKRRGVNLLSPPRVRWFGKNKKIHSLKEISSYCSLYPVQIIKILRLGSRLLKTLLEDASLNLRVILMVRDPRALLHSRKRVRFCNGECKNATIICQDYYEDYKVLKELEKVFPGRIIGIRFEDVASNPEMVIPELYDFCGLRSSESLQDFISAHTKPDDKHYIGKNTFNTFRNSSNVSVEWRQGLTWTEIDKIQKTCTKAMDAWGYNQVDKDSMMNVETFTANIP